MSLIGKFASVGGATMASRVLGFVREAMIAAFLGATACPGELEVIGDQTADGIAPPA